MIDGELCVTFGRHEHGLHSAFLPGVNACAPEGHYLIMWFVVVNV
jgi:hypothetical protein